MRKEKESQGSEGKQGEIKLTFKNWLFFTTMASCGQYSYGTICHTPIQKKIN
jgi:hypothetical protein